TSNRFRGTKLSENRGDQDPSQQSWDGRCTRQCLVAVVPDIKLPVYVSERGHTGGDSQGERSHTSALSAHLRHACACRQQTPDTCGRVRVAPSLPQSGRVSFA